MSSFERMRDRLPSLYRPEDDQSDEPLLPLSVGDFVEINGAPPPARSVAAFEGTLFITLPAPQRILRARLSPTVAYGSGYTLEFYHLDGDVPTSRPSAVARVQSGAAVLPVDFTDARFAVRLKRAGLLSLFLQSIGDVLEEVNREAGEVMQSHWYEYADRALFSFFYARTRQLLGLPSPSPVKAEDRLALRQFPYVGDLGQLGALLPVLPWQTPPALRELAEDYRDRLAEFVELYKNGLGTLDTLRRMIEVQLPALGAGEARVVRPFWVEEYTPLASEIVPVVADGEPTDMVGPLMRWRLTTGALEDVPPTVYVEGVAPHGDLVDATVNPLIELYQTDSTRVRAGLAFLGTVAPGQTLRLRPAYSSWLGRADGLRSALSAPAGESAPDPTAPGPWPAAEGAPAGRVVAVARTADGMLWAASNTGDAKGDLMRFNGRTWLRALRDLPRLLCLAADGPVLLVGTQAGLLQMPFYPPTANRPAPTYETRAVEALEGQAVNVVYRAPDGQLLAGSSRGVWQLTRTAAGYTASPFELRQDDTTRMEVLAIGRDQSGTLHFGTSLGLFQFQPAAKRWHWFEKEGVKEQARDWQEVFADKQGDAMNFPTAARVFLPPVRRVLRGADGSLWLGTQNGVARYVARATRGLTYATVLEAFPQLTTGPVFDIREDARGLLWFCTDRGLLRYDGREWWQARGDGWARVGIIDNLSGGPPRDTRQPPRGFRFDRAAGRWQRFDPRLGWKDFEPEPLTTAETAVLTVEWIDQVAADIGRWDGARFTSESPVAAAALRSRFKPSEDRILDGGVPALPRVPAGRASIWRYLSREPDPLQLPPERPAWTVEGRLIPPPQFPGAPPPGRFDLTTPEPQINYDEAVFAYRPAARVWFEFAGRKVLGVVARLKKLTADEQIDPVVIDRVWQGIQQVRPAGVRVALAVEEDFVKGKENG